MCRYPEPVSHPFCSISSAVKLGQAPLQIRISKLQFGMETRDERARRAAAPETTSTWHHTVTPYKRSQERTSKLKYFWNTPKLGILPNLPDNGSDRVLHCWPLNPVKYGRPSNKLTKKLASDTSVMCKSSSLLTINHSRKLGMRKQCLIHHSWERSHARRFSNGLVY